MAALTGASWSCAPLLTITTACRVACRLVQAAAM
jgi:hypothetical protein